MEKYKDIVLLARPDHSYLIYKSLLSSKLRFVYLCFKMFPRWLQSYIRDPRFTYYDKSYKNCKLLTLVHILRTQFGFKSLEPYEKPLFERKAKKLLDNINTKIIHYWPNFCVETIAEYKKNHPEVKTFADVYYPCELWVLDNIKPYLRAHNINSSFDDVERDAKNINLLMESEDNFLVPSKFIMETYRQYYPDKNYIVMPYGISIWDNYQKKSPKTHSSEITKFVYVGGVSVEKGCLLLLDIFSQHPDLELHIYGAINQEQEYLFSEKLACRNIYYHSTVPKSDLPMLVSQYDVGIHLSLFDAYSLAVGEVMGAGLPVIVSDKTGISDLVGSIHAGMITCLKTDSILECIDKIRNPNTYNDYVNNLDSYIESRPISYGDSIVDFYKNNI